MLPRPSSAVDFPSPCFLLRLSFFCPDHYYYFVHLRVDYDLLVLVLLLPTTTTTMAMMMLLRHTAAKRVDNDAFPSLYAFCFQGPGSSPAWGNAQVG